MPLPPSHNNFYDNEDDGEDYDGMRKKRHWGVEAGGHTYAKDKEEPNTTRYDDSPVVYPNTPTGRAMAARMNKGYHPDSPKYFVKGETPAEKEKERSKRLNFMDDA